ncbi:Ubiquitin carboxyl-terminal hydrolase 3 [Dichanthelium oligosanthes]|uniref:Ubiquitin carboxyl-terminal hydrolase n=1 Tax=Dichanthelium oligosanthes TaxID=888268 RepID=A0A1E5WAE0_9POAL|nr:Ubiquitin carboxyl-terminal hydrolase 3 [Dichanthelium oligosanthes]
MALPSPPSAGERWPPLESTPEVFNQFMWSLGVPENEAEFHDVYGLDADELDMVPQPVLAVILCFPDPPQDASYPSDLLLSYGEKETGGQVYFVKQIASLGNACGTIALIHAVGNSSSEINLGTYLVFCGGEFMLGLVLQINCWHGPIQGACFRALFLEKDDAMARAHSLAATVSQREKNKPKILSDFFVAILLIMTWVHFCQLCDVVEEHYICFVAVNGTLNELDGMKDGPITHGSSSSKSLLQDAVPVIKRIMCNIPDFINFNLMVLSRKQNNAGTTSYASD